MTNSQWIEMIESKRAEIETMVFEQWASMLTESESTSMRAVVLLWDDGAVTTGYRDQNNFSTGEHNGTAICIASFGSQIDRSTFDECESESEYISLMKSEYPVDVDEIINETVKYL